MKITASLDWSLIVECPACEGLLDLAQQPYGDDPDISHAIFNNAWDKLNGYEITCQFCRHELKIDEVEY